MDDCMKWDWGVILKKHILGTMKRDEGVVLSKHLLGAIEFSHTAA
jgi:hypothetical protein